MPTKPEFERVLTGIPIWLLRSYLLDLGARSFADGSLRGKGWSANLTQVEDYQIGSLRVGRVRLELWGDPDAVARVRVPLEQRLLRGGG